MIVRGKKRGFTLLEMLVALAIFAVIGVISSQLVGRIVDHHAVLSERGARLIEIQRAMRVIKRDVMQFVPRKIKGGYGDPRDALLIDNDGLLEFTRNGWRNPLQQRRSTLQRVAYVFDDDELKRYYWNVLDQVPDSRRFEQTLLENVESAEFLIIDEAGDTHSFLPGTGVEMKAIMLRMELPPYGLVERIWELPYGG